MARRPSPWTIRKHAKGSYYVRFTLAGRRVDRSTGCRDLAAAKGRAAEIYAEEVAGKGHKPAAAGGDIDILAAQWLAGVADVRTAAWAETCEMYQRNYWRTRWSDVRDITSAAVQRYVGERLSGIGAKVGSGKMARPPKPAAATTVRKELSALRSFLCWCLERGLIREMPTWRAPAGKSDYRAEWLSRAEFDAVLAALPSHAEHRTGSPVREYYTVMWATSFRRGTMARLRWDDLDLDAGTVTVRPSADKRQQGRTVPLLPEAVEALRALAPGVGLVFGARDYRKQWRKALAAAGVTRHITACHGVRHSRVSEWLSGTQNLAGVQHMTGHRQLATLQRYTHADLDVARSMLAEVEAHSGVRGGVPEPGGCDDEAATAGNHSRAREGSNLRPTDSKSVDLLRKR